MVKIGVFLFLILFLYSGLSQSSVYDDLSSIHLKFANTEKFVTTQKTTHSVNQKIFNKLSIKNADFIIQIETVIPVTSNYVENVKQAEFGAINRLYEPQLTPYPGEITHNQQCDRKLKPQNQSLIFLGKKTEAILSNTTKNNTFASCFDKDSNGPGLFLIAFDSESKAMIKIKIFDQKQKGTTSKESLINILQQIQKI